jgi:hypothetical protein
MNAWYNNMKEPAEQVNEVWIIQIISRLVYKPFLADFVVVFLGLSIRMRG